MRAVLDLTSALAQHGHKLTVLTTELPPAVARTASVNLSFICLDGGLVNTRPLDHMNVLRAAELVQSHDVLHVHGVWHYANEQLARAARAVDRPYIVSPRGMLDDWSMHQHKIRKRLYHMTFGCRHLERAAAVHCTAQGELDQSRKWFPQAKTVVAPNFLSLAPFARPLGRSLAIQNFPALASNRPSVLFLSRIHYKKGLDILVEAAAICTRQGLDATWVIAGSGGAGYEREVRELVRVRGLEDRFVFTGHVDADLKTSLFQSCTVFALPTSQENFGFVLYESLACATPVVTTTGVDTWPELKASGAADIVDRTPQAFARAIHSIIADPALRRRMSAAGLEWVNNELDESSLLARFDAMYEEAVNPASSSPQRLTSRTLAV